MSQAKTKPVLIDRPKPTQPSLPQQARGQIQKRLREQFEVFLAEANPEEQRFMAAILEVRE